MKIKNISTLYKLTATIFSGLLLLLVLSVSAYSQVPKPAEVYGFEVGADYKLADYDMMLSYYDKLDAASERVKKIQIGTTSMGRPMILLFISSEQNMQQLDRWRDISETLSRARIDSIKAQNLARQGKAVVWVDGGMHATELAHGQMTSELAYKIATEETAEMKSIRENVITLLMPVMNPDGLDIVSSWYNKNLDTPYETSGPPWLYQKYVGHDNNRDWFMNNMPETYHVNKVLYRQWYPQIVYNHHQTSPSWARIFVPPFSDPVNPNIHPAVTTGVNEVGAAMAQRFALKEMPGVISDIGYTMFWNGGGRTTPYYHNQIGILTETAHATPTPRMYDPESKPERIRGMRTDGTSILYPDPWQGGESHFRDAVDYMLTGTMAVLEIASDRKSNFLYNIYQMGRDAIEAGQSGDPYAYIFSPDQWDQGEARNLVNILYRGGVEIHRATESFSVNGIQYDEGTYLAYAGQAYRPFLMDLLEPQEYPTLRQYPGGPPDPPYDLAGWTLPMQMGVNINRANSEFDVPTEEIDGLVPVAKGSVADNPGYGYTLSPRPNASVKAVNQLLAKGASVYRAALDADEKKSGAFIIENTSQSSDKAKMFADSLGLDFTAINSKPDEQNIASLNLPKVGLYKSWMANMDEGWTRWLLENYHFAVDTLHDANIRNSDLSQYDAIIIPDQWPQGILHGHRPGEMPDKYTGGMGLEGAAALSRYAKEGGTLLTFDSASDFAIQQFGLPVRNVTQGLSTSQFFIPGSLIRMNVDTAHPLAHGMQDTVAASFSRSRAFEVFKQDTTGEGGVEDITRAPEPDVEIITRYAEDDLLMSGWAMGEKEYLAGKAAMMNIKYGDGQIILYGFRPQFRGQPRGTYKLIFNALYGATMDAFPAGPVATEE
jgi:glutamine amidotransferase-like uncharacterized protein